MDADAAGRAEEALAHRNVRHVADQPLYAGCHERQRGWSMNDRRSRPPNFFSNFVLPINSHHLIDNSPNRLLPERMPPGLVNDSRTAARPSVGFDAVARVSPVPRQAFRTDRRRRALTMRDPRTRAISRIATSPSGLLRAPQPAGDHDLWAPGEGLATSTAVQLHVDCRIRMVGQGPQRRRAVGA